MQSWWAKETLNKSHRPQTFGHYIYIYIYLSIYKIHSIKLNSKDIYKPIFCANILTFSVNTFILYPSNSFEVLKQKPVHYSEMDVFWNTSNLCHTLQLWPPFSRVMRLRDTETEPPQQKQHSLHLFKTARPHFYMQINAKGERAKVKRTSVKDLCQQVKDVIQKTVNTSKAWGL